MSKSKFESKKAIDKRKLVGKKLPSPFSQLSNTQFSSWKDQTLPDILWAVVLRGSLQQDRALELFRSMVVRFRDRFYDNPSVSLCHSGLASVSGTDFDYLFSDLLVDDSVARLLRPLALIDALPDSRHWRRWFPDIHSSQDDWEILAAAVMPALDHQSQESTDVRWLKVVSLCLIGKLRIPDEILEDLRLYPNRGDQRRVRPMIRAAEMSLRPMSLGSNGESAATCMDSEVFWSELLLKTPCMGVSCEFDPPTDQSLIREEIETALNSVSIHFMRNISTSAIDPRADGAFGLSLYGLTLALELAVSPSQFLAGGRIVLRSIVESFVTLSFLAKKDDPTIWTQYRSYGAGQTALAWIKATDSEEWPDFIDRERLEMLANEDIWLEMRDIDLGSWANTDLRKMADFADVKDVYDKYYSWTSGFSHGHWGCVRDSTLSTCLNPLHRLHRVPSGISQMPSVLQDACKVCNRSLDRLNSMYPGIKKRIDWKQRPPSPSD